MQTDKIQRNLIRALIIYEVLVISAVAYAGVTIALSGGAPIYAAVPVFMVSASEALRIPLSAWATRLSFGSRLLALIVLACLALASAEGIALSLDTLFSARIEGVSRAQRRLEMAKGDLAKAERIATPFKSAIATSDREIISIDQRQTALIASSPTAPGFSGRSCGKRGNGPCAIDMTAQASYRKALAEHAKQISAIEAERKAARAARANAESGLSAVDLATPGSSAVAIATREVAEAAEASPVHRIAGAVFDVKAAELTPGQLSVFRKYAIGGVSVALASMSALVAWLAFQQPRPSSQSKLSRAIRAYVARKRRPVIRVVEKHIPAGVKTRVVYVPTSDGKLLKRGHAESINAYAEMN